MMRARALLRVVFFLLVRAENGIAGSSIVAGTPAGTNADDSNGATLPQFVSRSNSWTGRGGVLARAVSSIATGARIIRSLSPSFRSGSSSRSSPRVVPLPTVEGARELLPAGSPLHLPTSTSRPFDPIVPTTPGGPQHRDDASRSEDSGHVRGKQPSAHRSSRGLDPLKASPAPDDHPNRGRRITQEMKRGVLLSPALPAERTTTSTAGSSSSAAPGALDEMKVIRNNFVGGTTASVLHAQDKDPAGSSSSSGLIATRQQVLDQMEQETWQAGQGEAGYKRFMQKLEDHHRAKDGNLVHRSRLEADTETDVARPAAVATLQLDAHAAKKLDRHRGRGQGVSASPLTEVPVDEETTTLERVEKAEALLRSVLPLKQEPRNVAPHEDVELDPVTEHLSELPTFQQDLLAAQLCLALSTDEVVQREAAGERAVLQNSTLVHSSTAAVVLSAAQTLRDIVHTTTAQQDCPPPPAQAAITVAEQEEDHSHLTTSSRDEALLLHPQEFSPQLPSSPQRWKLKTQEEHQHQPAPWEVGEEVALLARLLDEQLRLLPPDQDETSYEQARQTKWTNSAGDDVSSEVSLTGSLNFSRFSTPLISEDQWSRPLSSCPSVFNSNSTENVPRDEGRPGVDEEQVVKVPSSVGWALLRKVLQTKTTTLRQAEECEAASINADANTSAAPV
ncbi:unnamed protein product [Amoebophrya sp. A120]|nr:unnamed protein product [Amoebophrya sp. A120]CAD7975414.1 unnamed protein product [Amoebophrya sp. A120]|eukprot:GSA120T00001426001.1